MADPLWSVLLLVTIDIIGMAPTFRKAYHKPNEEQCLFFALITLRNIISIAALEHYSLTTLSFPVATSAACIALIMMIISRRKAVI